MKTYPLIFENHIHIAIKHAAESQGESIKQFIMQAIKARLPVADYIETNRELLADLQNRDQIDFIEIDAVENLFR